MSLPPKAEMARARALLSAAARESRGRLARPVLLGTASITCGIAQAWFIARLLATLLGLGESPWGQAGWPELAAAAALALLSTALTVAQERAQAAAGAAARARLRNHAFAALLAAGPADERPVGERAALVVDRIEALDGYFSRWLPAAILAVAGPLLIAVAVAAADPVSGVILLVAGALVPVAMAVTGIGAALASRRQFDALQALSGRFLDRMRGLPQLVLFRRQEAEAEALSGAATELRRRTMKVLRVAFLSGLSLEAIAAAVLGCLAWRHGHLLVGGHPAPVAALFSILLVPAFFAPLRAFSAAYHERMAANGAAAALAPLLETPPEAGLKLEEIPPSLVVTFEGVGLTYDAARGAALSDLSFRVMPGETLVLAGPSGSGKSSVLRLLMGFRRPDTGRIAFNGRDATALAPAELRRLSAYVGQKAHLFRATIRENIALARPDATPAQVEAAARAARVTDFTADMPEGLDTLVGEGGFGLSGGQAQRVAIARAFLRDAPMVLLDEPTAHLDPGTESDVLDSLRRLCAGRTAIIATHSPALRARFTRVLELEHGRAAAGARMAGE
ncbi:thiol reductant ABC exporter subunit CydD [Roseomonas marmotae]|uniref:Thiol reductant ABC exporter subunit CydD n=1 Tax=Roseomonas marmotae TaxID=2768161 RepID=A0ABS3KEW4_9PROT|nr:thiol reductant ABC exporter subunit CydD [Roseomonas marmotae]MBO1076006.1 thiol reductant ABC exporter subunit CydD [Roseomonas marmotae]QTI80138.1 thiol reductant ABC exporter subunit CydD [Roseomonas marmotae]